MTIPGHRHPGVSESDLLAESPRTLAFSRRSVLFPAALGLTIAFAALTRAVHLGTKTLWSDEVASIVIAKLHWADFWRVVTTNEANMSFYYLLLRLWVHLGDQPSYVKFLSVLPGVVVVPVVYWIGREILSREAGIFAALLLSVNVFHIRYSQEARSYSLVVLLVALSFLSFLRCVRQQDHSWGACHVVFSVLALYAHFFTALALFAQLVSLVFLPRSGKLAHKPVQHFFILAVLGTPLLWFVLFRNNGQLDWLHPATAKELYHLFLYMTGSGLKFGIALVAFVIALRAWASRAREQWTMQTWSFAVLVVGLFLPICITFVTSFWKPVFLARFLIVCLPAAMLLIAYGLVEISQQWIRYALVALMVLSAIRPIRAYYAEPGPQDWRSAVGYIAGNASAGDIAFLPGGYCEMPLRYYIDHAGDVPTFPVIVSAAPEKIRGELLNGSGHIWVVSCEAVRVLPTIPGYSAEHVRRFEGIVVTEFARTPLAQQERFTPSALPYPRGQREWS